MLDLGDKSLLVAIGGIVVSSGTSGVVLFPFEKGEVLVASILGTDASLFHDLLVLRSVTLILCFPISIFLLLLVHIPGLNQFSADLILFVIHLLLRFQSERVLLIS